MSEDKEMMHQSQDDLEGNEGEDQEAVSEKHEDEDEGNDQKEDEEDEDENDNEDTDEDEDENENEDTDEDENENEDTDEDEEEDEDADQPIPNQLVTLLQSIKQPGDFSDHGTLELFHSPGLEVEGIGMIGLPLSEPQAQQLKQKCTQAPFGRGEKTILDTTVRKTLQLQPSQFKLNNAFQSNTIREIQDKLQMALGVSDRKINLELYKLLLYDEGSFFKKHRDSEKSDGMFATLVVLLPSVYEGGEIVIYHGNEKRSIDLSKQNKYELGWISFYADCEHEVLPLKSGYRLALVYNVCFTKIKSSESIPTSLDNSFISKFGSIFEKWNKNPSMIAIKLAHDYSFKSLRVDHLKNVSKKYTKRSSDDPELDYEVEHWVDSENEVVPLGDLIIDPKCFYPSDAFDDVDEYDQNEKDTGNEGTLLELWYRYGFILIWPINFSRAAFFGVNCIQSVFQMYRDARAIAAKESPSFNNTNPKWLNVLRLSKRLSNFQPSKIGPFFAHLSEFDDVDDPIGRKHTKQFFSSPKSISQVEKNEHEFFKRLKSLISKFGGWSQWKESILALAKNLESPYALLIWLLDTHHQENERKEILNFAIEFLPSKSIDKEIILFISKFDLLQLAIQILPQCLEIACSLSGFHKSYRWEFIDDETEMRFPQITDLLQGFGFNEKLCEIVENFFRNKINNNNEFAIVAVWSMFFQQSSLRRLRIKSTKSIVRFGRLIGLNKEISDRKRAILKLVLNEFASSRLSTTELTSLISGCFTDSTSMKYARNKIFSKGYFEKLRGLDSLKYDFTIDGPRGEAKKKFAKLLFSMVYDKSKLAPLESQTSARIGQYYGEWFPPLFLLSLATYISDFESYKEIVSWIKTKKQEKKNHFRREEFDEQFQGILAVGAKVFQNESKEEDHKENESEEKEEESD